MKLTPDTNVAHANVMTTLSLDEVKE